MSDIENLEKRLATAIANLSGGADLAAENAKLKSELAALKKLRKADVAELDTLLAKLKPMLEGAENA
ncbi:MAG: hypothetical protein JKY31_11860 [Rhodobacteraceae bacterium]|nr:hypothetical protein [Paracoccaceae bacterium]